MELKKTDDRTLSQLKRPPKPHIVNIKLTKPIADSPHECPECKFHHVRSWSSGNHTKTVHKCGKIPKPRGVGYDLKAHQKACVRFLLKEITDENDP